MAQKRRQARHASASTTSNLKPFYIILGIVAVLGIAGIAYTMRGSGGTVTQPVDLAGIDDPQALVAQARGVAVGPENAPVQVLVFSDYMCPWCANFALGSEKQIKSEFVDGGQVQFIYYDFPLGGSHVHSFLAARAARCAEDQGRFWDYHDILFARQNSWMVERSAPTGTLQQYAGELGLDQAAFRGCLESDRHAQLVTANYVLGAQLGVNSTPTVFVNGRRVDRPVDWSSMRAAIQQHLGS